MKKNDYRPGLKAADFIALDGEEMQTLAAAAVEKAMQRRERDNGQDLAVMRRKYQEDARQEMIVRAYDMVFGPWIHGTMDDGTPRAEMPLALFAAIAAGRALDSIIYQDGGHNVKLSAKEAREHYDGDTSRAVITCKRLSDPVAPSPESAAISAELLPRILEYISGDKTREHAAALLALMYTGHTIPEAAAEMGIKERRAQEVFRAVCNAAALVKVADGESADLERLIAAERETESNNATYSRAYKDAAAALMKVSDGTPPAPVVKWTDKKPAAALDLSRMTYKERIDAYAEFSALARAIYTANSEK